MANEYLAPYLDFIDRTQNLQKQNRDNNFSTYLQNLSLHNPLTQGINLSNDANALIGQTNPMMYADLNAQNAKTANTQMQTQLEPQKFALDQQRQQALQNYQQRELQINQQNANTQASRYTTPEQDIPIIKGILNGTLPIEAGANLSYAGREALAKYVTAQENQTDIVKKQQETALLMPKFQNELQQTAYQGQNAHAHQQLADAATLRAQIAQLSELGTPEVQKALAIINDPSSPPDKLSLANQVLATSPSRVAGRALQNEQRAYNLGYGQQAKTFGDIEQQVSANGGVATPDMFANIDTESLPKDQRTLIGKYQSDYAKGVKGIENDKRLKDVYSSFADLEKAGSLLSGDLNKVDQTQLKDLLIRGWTGKSPTNSQFNKLDTDSQSFLSRLTGSPQKLLDGKMTPQELSNFKKNFELNKDIFANEAFNKISPLIEQGIQYRLPLNKLAVLAAPLKLNPKVLTAENLAKAQEVELRSQGRHSKFDYLKDLSDGVKNGQ
jgi:hypothetical protein